MKTLIKTTILILIAALCLTSCKKPGCDPGMMSSNYFGTWEVRRVYGGNINPPDSVYQPGNGNILQLNPDSTYQRYVQHNLTGQGVYHIIKNGFTDSQVTRDELFFDADTSTKSIISESMGTLTVSPLIPDIASTDYQRIQ